MVVTGRGAISAPPARVAVGQATLGPIAAWAGPWPLDERWWDPARRRRAARFQLLTESGRAYLAMVEGGQWWVIARYT